MTGPLRIGIDARELLGEATGVGRYLGELLLRWTARSDAARGGSFCTRPKRCRCPSRPTRQRSAWSVPARDAAPGGSRCTCEGRSQGSARRFLRAGLHGAARDAGASGRDHPRHLVCCASGVVPAARRLPPALAHPPRRALRRDRLHRLAVLPPGDRSSVSTSTPRASPSFRRESRTAAGDAVERSSREPVVLFVGSLFNRRRLPDLIAAFAQATTDLPDGTARHRRRRPHVAAAGPGSGCRRSTAFRLAPSFDATLPIASSASSTRRASVFAFLSEYEGFGMTPLEALSAGVPPVVLDTAGRTRGVRRRGDLRRRRRHRGHGRRTPPAADRAVERGADSRRGAGGARRGTRGTPPRIARSSTSRGSRGSDDASRSSSSATTLDADLERCLRVSPRRAAVDAARHHGRRQRLDRGRPRRHPIAMAGHAGHRARAEPRALPRATTPASARHAASCSSCSTATPSCRLERWTRSSRGCSAHPTAAAAGPRLIDAAGQAELSFGPMISPLGELRQKVLGALYSAGIAPVTTGSSERRGGSSTSTGSAAHACSSRAPTRRPSDCSTSASSSTPRTSTSVPPCAPAAGGFSSRRPSEITHLRGRSRATRAGRDERRVPAQPDRILREASPGLGPGVARISAPEGRAWQSKILTSCA